jgi:hypothetical protein
VRVVLSFLTIGVLVAAFYLAAHPVPSNWIPWRFPVLDEKPTPFAHLQINRLRLDREACLATLRQASTLRVEPQADHVKGDSCGFTNVVRAEDTPVDYNIQPITTCALMAALYWWNREIEALAIRELGSSIDRIEQIGTYACRNVNSRITGSRSQHATANAIDIAGFVLADGRSIVVSRHWQKDGPEGRFLKAAHDAACTYFNGVLGPNYNTLHADHFHLDLGGYLICR